MKRLLLLLCCCLLLSGNGAYPQQTSFENTASKSALENSISAEAGKIQVYSEKNKFGLKDANDKVITKPIYKKMIKLGNSSWIVLYKGRYGLLNSKGEFIIPPKYRNVDRVLGKYAKFGNSNDFGLYDEFGNTVIPPEYSSVDIMYGGMFLTCKNYKYGIVDLDGNSVLDNEFEEIYMPKPNVIIIRHNGMEYSVETVSGKEITLPSDTNKISEENDFKITNLVVNTGVVSGYSVVTLTDYMLKMLSALSPAYEAAIDELMFSQGAETISILMKFTWLPKFPIVYVKNYYKHIRRPNNGPLANTRNSLKKQMK